MKCFSCGGFTEQVWKYCPNCGTGQVTPAQGGFIHIYGGQAGCNATLGGNASMEEPNAVLRRPGLKLDGHKAQVYTGVFLSFPYALEAIARKTIEGCGDPGHVLHGWKEVPDGFKRYSEAFARHALEEGKARDPVQAYDAMVTTTWNSLARLEHHHLRSNTCGSTDAACQSQQKG